MDFRSFRLEMKDTVASKGEFNGYAAIYGNEDRNGEVIDPGAMKRSIDHADGEFPLLWQHQKEALIGMVRLEDDARGAKAFGKVNLDIDAGRQAFKMMVPMEGFTRGALRDLSIGYIVKKDEMHGSVRHLKEIQLLEVSLVTIAANPKTNITRVKEAAEQQSYEERLVAIETTIKEFSTFKSALKAIGATLAERDMLDDPDLVDSLSKFFATGPGSDSGDPVSDHSLEELRLEQALSNELRRQGHGKQYVGFDSGA